MLLFGRSLKHVGWTFVLGMKQSVRVTCVQFHSFGSRIYFKFTFMSVENLAEPETLKLG